MFMQREILAQLEQWKSRSRKHPLVLCGARQVGKTHVLKEFGRTHYKRFVYLDLLSDEAKLVYQNDFDAKRTLQDISALTRTKIDPTDTLLIIDEIQEVPRALAFMKAFDEQVPEQDIVAAGSYLGVSLHAGLSFPVGKVDLVDMHPMSFREFLRAAGEDILADEIVAPCDFERASVVAARLERLLRQYYFVGGMPEAVTAFLEGNADYEAARRVQGNLLAEYDRDFSKHIADSRELSRTRLTYQSIPVHLGRENHKFVFGHIEKGARARDYETSLQWIIDSGLAHRVYRTDKAARPLSFYRDLSAFKLYLHDVGLLGAAMEVEPKDVILTNRALVEYKGAMTEQFVCQELVAAGREPYYWTGGSSAEVDFMVNWDGSVAPIEVKAEENLTAKSLKSLCGRTSLHGYRLSMSPYREQDWMTNIPLWAAGSYFENKGGFVL